MVQNDDKWDDFVRLIGEGCTVALAANGAGVDRSDAYKRRKVNQEFADAWDAACKARRDKLIAEAERRALAGSDKLLIFLLCNYHPEQFRQPTQRVDLANAPGEKFEITDDARAQRISEIMAAAAIRKAQSEDLV